MREDDMILEMLSPDPESIIYMKYTMDFGPVTYEIVFSYN